MKKEEVYLIDLSGNGFRCGALSRIIGVYMCTPEGLTPRLCYHIIFDDGKEDYKPCNEEHYLVITKSKYMELLEKHKQHLPNIK